MNDSKKKVSETRDTFGYPRPAPKPSAKKKGKKSKETESKE